MLGLAPSGKAADVLGAETIWPATTLAQLLTDAARPGYRPLPPGTTVVLDEAGMAATDDLDALVGMVGRHGWASYSSRIRALYSAVNERRRGRAAGSGSSTSSSWARAIKDAVVMVIGLRVPVSPCREGRVQQVSHVSLTDRGPAALNG